MEEVVIIALRSWRDVPNAQMGQFVLNVPSTHISSTHQVINVTHVRLLIRIATSVILLVVFYVDRGILLIAVHVLDALKIVVLVQILQIVAAVFKDISCQEYSVFLVLNHVSLVVEVHLHVRVVNKVSFYQVQIVKPVIQVVQVVVVQLQLAFLVH